MADDKITAQDMRGLLRGRFKDPSRYAVAEEVFESTGCRGRRLDMVVASFWASDGFAIEGIEVKVSKADLKHELESPQKHGAFFKRLDFYSLAAPREIIDMDLIPKQWGVYEAVRQKGGLVLKAKRRPIALHDPMLDYIDRDFFASLLRKLYNCSPSQSRLAEERLKGHEEGVRDAERSRNDKWLKKRCAEMQKEVAEFRTFWAVESWRSGGNLDEMLDRAETLKRIGSLDASWTAGRIDRLITELSTLSAILRGDEDSTKDERND